ncbi:hypothetical protein ACO03V_14500 [Microbacterium sp. HMH0099]|uniref:hypothetical protein n=1 Tax=Microbacterium sp. HMH0099 TaxID=3414026 RepID=UPI003BF743B3
MTADTVVRIGTQVLELPYADALTVFRTAVVTARRGGPVPISPDTCVWVSASTNISLTRPGQYADEYTQLLAEPLDTKPEPQAVILR